MSRLARLSPRAEKTIRLVVACVVAAPLGTISVLNDDEALGYIAVAIVVGGILVGPLMARFLSPGEPRKGR